MPIAEVGAERQLDRFVSSKQLVKDSLTVARPPGLAARGGVPLRGHGSTTIAGIVLMPGGEAQCRARHAHPLKIFVERRALMGELRHGGGERRVETVRQHKRWIDERSTDFVEVATSTNSRSRSRPRDCKWEVSDHPDRDHPSHATCSMASAPCLYTARRHRTSRCARALALVGRIERKGLPQ